MKVADARLYRPYRQDLTLDVRQMQVALRKLRAFAREGGEEELDLEGTIDATAQNGGELEVVTRPPRRHNTRIILMMDVGGSMDPFAHLCSRLFSAAKKSTHFKELRTYYFHNCVYGHVYETERFDTPIKVRDLIQETGSHYKLIVVGDALMAPYELLAAGGSLDLGDDRGRVPFELGLQELGQTLRVVGRVGAGDLEQRPGVPLDLCVTHQDAPTRAMKPSISSCWVASSTPPPPP